MISRQEKKTPKKVQNKPCSKNKNSLSIRTAGQSNQKPLSMATSQLLRRKYVDRQLKSQNSEVIHRMIRNANKVTTQLRMICSQRDYVSRVYVKPAGSLQVRLKSENPSQQKFFSLARIVTNFKINKILCHYRKSKNSLLHKSHKIQSHDKNTNIQPPFLSKAFEDSESCLKTLVSKIENMIKSEYELIENHNILDELQNDLKESQCEIIFGDDEDKISEINCTTKANSQQATCIKPKKAIERKAIKELNQLRISEPLLAEKGIIDEYCILRCPPPVMYFKRKKDGKNKKKEFNSSSDSKNSKSVSQSFQKKESQSMKKKQKARKNISPYQQQVSKTPLKSINSKKKILYSIQKY